MPAQPFHLSPFDLQVDRVIHNQVTCHDGGLGTTAALFPFGPLAVMISLHPGLHLDPKVTQPDLSHGVRRPLPPIEEPGQTTQTDFFADHT